MVLFLMPWVMGLAFHERGAYGRGGALRGAFAALGICLKPHFLVFPIFVTLALALRERNLRPLLAASNISIIAMGAGYVAFVWVVHPAYFLEIVPTAVLTYGAYGGTNSQVILNIGIIKLLFVALLLLECWRQKSLPQGLGPLAALYFAGVASYTLQWTGYGYQAVPVHSFGLILCGFLILRSPVKAIIRSAIICALMISLLSIHRGFYKSLSVQNLAAELVKGPTESGITILSSHVFLGPIVALELGVPWHNRYPALWTVPAIANAKAEAACNQTEAVCAELQVLAAETRANVLEDLQTGLPDAIVFDKKAGYFNEPGFSYEVFLRRSAGLSDFFDGYTQRVSTDRFDILYK
ncbi:hypothetical protein [Cognatishimia maritima]|uniref:hypothetical protein n=1 Tax=Cognatishimia maritima TaxID=870908 RepID=UPI0010425B1C|nr:hypothetical protein [Cognatishimia maritima]